MQFGINGTGLVQKADIARIIEHARQAQRDGFGSYWLAEHPTGGLDALTVLSAVAREVPKLALGTAIVPTMTRHPMVLAAQAQTVQQLMSQTLTLGVGLSHAVMMADLGIGFDKPIRHLKEFLAILMPLLEAGEVDTQGETLSARGKFFINPPTRPRVLVAALGPQALKVTGRVADGTVLAWVGPRTIGEHIAPTISAAASDAGRAAPQVVASLPVCVTDQPDAVRNVIGKGLRWYGDLPSYRAMFDREGVEGPADVAIVGSASQVRAGVQALRDAGATEFAPSEFYTNAEEAAATRAVLKELI